MNKIFRTNLLISLAYHIVVGIGMREGVQLYDVRIFSLAILIVLQFFINLIIFLVTLNVKQENHYLISTFLVLLIGFGACISTLQILG
jgi:hypothetical protein